MATEPLLDFDALLKPIPGDDPAGVKMPFTLRQELDDARKDINPDEFDADDPRRPEQAQKADWAGIIRKTQDALEATGKDLHLAARLTEALTKLHGFAGLHDGLHLMRLLVEQCWDRLTPPITSDEDLEIRAAPFNWLDDTERGALFPTTVRAIPLLVGDTTCSWLDWKHMMDGKGTLTSEQFDKAMAATAREQLQAASEVIDQVNSELEALATGLNDKLQAAASSFTSLRPAVADCQTLLAQMLKRKGGPKVEAEAEADASQVAGQPQPTHLGSREQVYQQLAEAAARLQSLEPHSPVPYIINKAVEFGSLTFPELMRLLIRDDNILNEMNRELGIKETPPPPAAQ